ncbi:MAG: phosphonate metabolism transcriptional regulator PhnF [Rhodospirillaceae bacterium]|nr:phosphonate metabolism transcriptional regulator PhnF [Magnetovibrio sp.]MAY66198.1 phosphonate metabolism transcriptional regulator PhnF [Rhodospirillaceae bacterium]
MDPTSVKRGSGVSLWRQIEEQISDDIASGMIAPGSRLPTEHDLAERFNVNRHTVRRAMKGLEQEGLIRIEQGRGTFVHEHVIDYPVRRRTRFTENIMAQRRQPGGWVVLSERVKATSDVAEALDLEVGALVTLIRTIGEADGRPISIADHFFCAKRFPGMIDGFEESRSISKVLAQFGITDFFRKITRVTTRMPDNDESQLLSQPPNRPVLVAESINVDTEGKPVEYCLTRFAGDRVQLLFEPST